MLCTMYNSGLHVATKIPESVKFLLVKLCPLPKVSTVVVSIKGRERKRKVGGGGHIRQKQLHVHLVYHAIIRCIIK